MDNEMIERVIKASFDCWAKDKGKNFVVTDLSDSEYSFAVKHAIAIIKAMREPTEKMLIAGSKIDTETLEWDTWQAMIDAVISDETSN